MRPLLAHPDRRGKKKFAYSVVSRGKKLGYALRNQRWRYGKWPDGEELYRAEPLVVCPECEPGDAPVPAGPQFPVHTTDGSEILGMAGVPRQYVIPDDMVAIDQGFDDLTKRIEAPWATEPAEEPPAGWKLERGFLVGPNNKGNWE